MSATVVRELVATLGLKVTDAGFKAADSLFAGIARQVEMAGQKIQGLANYAAAGAGAIGTGLGAAVRSIVSDVSDANAGLAKTAQVLGTSVQDVQKWQHAAAASGGTADDISAAAEHVAALFQHASMGSAQAVMSLAKFGVTAKNARGEAKSFAEIFEDLANSEKFKRSKDGLKLSNDFREIFGGTGLLGLARKSAEERKELLDAPRAFGAEKTAEDIEATKAYRGELSKLGLVFTAIKQSVAGPVQQALARSTEKFNAWWKSLNGSGARDIRSGFDQLSKFTDMLASGMILLGKAAIFVGNHFDLIAVAIGAIMATGLLFWVNGLVATMTAGGALALLAWLPLVAFFGALFLIVDDVMTMLRGGNSLIGEFFPNLSARIKEISDLFKKDKWEQAFFAISDLLVDAFTAAITKISQKFADLAGGIGRKFLRHLTMADAQELVDKQKLTKEIDERQAKAPLTETEAYSNPIYRAGRKALLALEPGRAEADAEVGGKLMAMLSNMGEHFGAKSGALEPGRTEAGSGPLAGAGMGPSSASPSGGAAGRGGTQIGSVSAPVTFNLPGVTDPVIASQQIRREFERMWEEKMAEAGQGQ